MDSLSELLECSVCLEALGANHKVLPCQHTFCIPCLEIMERKWRSKKLENSIGFPCPECRVEVNVSLDKLPSNVILNRLLESLERGNISKKYLVSKSTTTTPNSHIMSSPPRAERYSVFKDLKVGGDKATTCSIPGNLSTNPFLTAMSSKTTFPTSLDSSPLLPPKPTLKPPEAPLRNTLPRKPSPAPRVPHQVYRALYNYVPTRHDELALQMGELYCVVDKCSDGWYRGSSIGSLKTGVFPGNYVQHVQHDEKRTTPVCNLIDLGDERYRAVASYPASTPQELDLQRGDVLTVIKRCDDGWCKGVQQRTGKTGLFPASFLEKF